MIRKAPVFQINCKV